MGKIILSIQFDIFATDKPEKQQLSPYLSFLLHTDWSNTFSANSRSLKCNSALNHEWMQCVEEQDIEIMDIFLPTCLQVHFMS